MADFALFFAPWGPFCGSQRRAPDDGIVFLLQVIPEYQVVPKTSGLPELSGNTRSFGLPATRRFLKLNQVGSVSKKYRVAGRVRVPAGHWTAAVIVFKVQGSVEFEDCLSTLIL